MKNLPLVRATSPHKAKRLDSATPHSAAPAGGSGSRSSLQTQPLDAAQSPPPPDSEHFLFSPLGFQSPFSVHSPLYPHDERDETQAAETLAELARCVRDA